MNLRILDVEEHKKTRRLWETVFPEDSQAFLDYYYFFKVKDNHIYVIEEDKDIRSMLQLNPYVLCIGDHKELCHYIIAVATEEPYRRRGYMGKLLMKAMQDMYRKKEPFTYLMPAAEAIYAPYDFCFIYWQNQTVLKGTEGKAEVDLADAGLSDAAEMSAFFNRYFAEKWQLYAQRDEAYYQRQIFEQQSEGGGIKLMKAADGLVGMFLWAREEQTEILEPLYLPEYEQEFQKCVYAMRKEQEHTVRVYAAGNPEGERKPMIMVRILRIEKMLSLMKAKQDESLDCSFAVLDPLIVQNNRVWKLTSPAGSEKIEIRETEDSQGAITVRALTEFLFGCRNPAQLAGEENVILPESLQSELKKIIPLQNIYLNELV